MGCGNSKTGNRVVESVSENPSGVPTPRTLTNKEKPQTVTENGHLPVNTVTAREGAIEALYEFKETLGRGAFAEVRRAVFRPTTSSRAIKVIHKIGLSPSLTEARHKLRELSVLRQLDHPNILRVHELYEDKNRYYVVMEYCDGGDLFEKLLSEKKFTENTAGKIMRQILAAVAYCHERKVIHRDLKPENLLLETRSQELTLKVADFGSSAFIDPKKKLSGVHGSAYYIAPEVLREAYNEKCDLWSCGIILYILLTGKAPYPGRSEKAILESVYAGDLDVTGLEKVSSAAKDLTLQLLNRNVRERISAREAMQHPFIENCEREEHEQHLAGAIESLREFHCSSKLKDAIHTFIATQIITREDTKELRESFQAIDRNGDGRISREELLAKYTSLLPSSLAEQEVSEIMSQVDTNRSGFIDYTEFLHACLDRAKHLNNETLRLAFSLFDKDRSGTLSSSELRDMFAGSAITNDRIWEEIVEEVDQNGDGEIDLREFQDLLMRKT